MNKYIVFSYALVMLCWVCILIGKITLGGHAIVPTWAIVICLAIITNFLIAIIVAFYRILK